MHDGVKLLGDVCPKFLFRKLDLAVYTSQGSQHLRSPIYIIASRASKSAIDAIEKNGGKVVCKYYNSLALQDCVEGRVDRISAAPTRREDIGKLFSILSEDSFITGYLVWYGKHRNRGFMSSETLQSLEGMPFVEERWKLLASELGKWSEQKIEEKK